MAMTDIMRDGDLGRLPEGKSEASGEGVTALPARCEERLGLGGTVYRCDLLEAHEGPHVNDVLVWATPREGGSR